MASSVVKRIAFALPFLPRWCPHQRNKTHHIAGKIKKRELAPLILWGGRISTKPKSLKLFVFFFWNGDFKQV
jgi:hypothetical protein